MFWCVAPSPALDHAHRQHGPAGVLASLYPSGAGGAGDFSPPTLADAPNPVPAPPSVASQLIQARPGGYGYCPGCGGRTYGKCGSLTLWHWAHESLHDCDKWSEHEGEWHFRWKSLVPPDRREVVIGPHRADILNTRGTVIELQHSPLAPAEIRERERHYQHMIWVLDAAPFKERLSFRRGDDHHTFAWKHPKKSWWEAKAPVFLDLGSRQLFLVKAIERQVPCIGWGHFIDRKTFVDLYFV